MDQAPLSGSELKFQIEKYQNFIKDQLKPQLEQVLKRREELYNTSSEYLKLNSTIEAMRTNNQKTIKTKIELGCGVFCQANIEDARYIYIAVGHGFHLQLTLPEALKFIEKKLIEIQKKTDKDTEDISKLKVHIQAMLDAITDLIETQ